MNVLYFICVSRLVRYWSSVKEAIAGETSSSINLLFRCCGTRFKLRFDDGTMLENHPRREISIIYPIVKEDGESILSKLSYHTPKANSVD